MIYLDDIVVFGTNFEEHLNRVEEVLDRLQVAGLKLKPEKCQLFRLEVDFLGHVVSADGVRPNPHNIAKNRTVAGSNKCNGCKTNPWDGKLLPSVS